VRRRRNRYRTRRHRRRSSHCWCIGMWRRRERGGNSRNGRWDWSRTGRRRNRRARRSRSCNSRTRSRTGRRRSPAWGRSTGRLRCLRSGRSRRTWIRRWRSWNRRGIGRGRTGGVPLLLQRGLRVFSHVIELLYGRVDDRNHMDLRRIGRRIRNILGHRQLIFIAGAAKIFVRNRRLGRGHQLRIQPAMHGLPSPRPGRPYPLMPRRLRRSHNRAAGHGEGRDDCPLAQPERRPRRFLRFHALGDIGE